MEEGANMDKINVVGYVRVSTDLDSQTTSYQGQKKYLEQYCKQHNFELLQVYQDRLSGTSVKNRDGLLQLLGLAGIQYDNTHNVFKLVLGWLVLYLNPKISHIFLQLLKDVDCFNIFNISSFVLIFITTSCLY